MTKEVEMRERLVSMMNDASLLITASLSIGRVSDELIPAIEEYRRKASALADAIMRTYYLIKNKLSRIEELPEFMVSDVELAEITDLMEDLEIQINQLKKSYEEIKQRIQEDMRFR
ncbi:MAG: hypothetical protein ACP5KE_09755, partial [Candidatus Methanodesulfokora sp.]